MKRYQIILAILAYLACQPISAQQPVVVAPQMADPYSVPSAQPPAVGAPTGAYIKSQPVFQPASPVTPVYPPPQSTVVPLPSQTPGSIFAPQVAPAPTLGGWGNAPETLPTPPGAMPQPPTTGVMPQPLATAPPAPVSQISIPAIDEELAWDQIADVVSDYFTISREQPARRSGEVWTEGRIDTAPLDGATWLQPFRKDSVGTFNRWESTFQSIRRHATVRVIPDASGYTVEVVVEKELEDLPKPERATVGPAAFNHPASLPSRRLETISREPPSPRWLALGRDPALEQRMLADIHARFSGAATSGSVFGP